MEDDNNTTFDTYNYTNSDGFQYYMKIEFIKHVTTCIIISIGLPLTLVTIYALYSLVRKDHVAPIYVINLLITDLFQLCCFIVLETEPKNLVSAGFHMRIVEDIYFCLLHTSVGFMVCVSLERYLVIVHPLWYRFRRTIKTSVVVCVGVWVIPPILFTIVFVLLSYKVQPIILSLFLISPLPLFVFFLVGTLRALSSSVSVSSEEKRRIVGILVLVLLIYTLLFLPIIIYYMKWDMQFNNPYEDLSFMFVKLSPLADLSLYLFVKKDIVGRFLAAACCCKMESNDNDVPAVNVDDI